MTRVLVLLLPMREIYQMFRGTLAPEQVLSAAGSQPDGQFYGHLYLGLYFEALGMKDRALEHIKIAASDRLAATCTWWRACTCAR
jgi:hypothetical protein